MIISASRRTDIPAFYTPWFMNRIRDGFLYIKNPFNAHQIKEVDLSPEAVDAIVFWTRNPAPLIPYLDELDEKGFHYYFQYTITGFPRELEKSTPTPYKAIETFKDLSKKIGKDKVIWRFDPILLSSLVDENEHKRLFQKIGQNLEGYTNRVVISFADIYKKVQKNLGDLSAEKNIHFQDIVEQKNTLNQLACDLSEIAKGYGFEIQSCAEEVDLDEVGIEHGKCIDDKLLNGLFNLGLDSKKDKGQREACGCIKSIDIGQYNTCLHGCSYCYATFNNKVVVNNKKKHDENSPFLIGSVEDVNPEHLPKKSKQVNLF